jgi:type IV secretory pathway component VirB8
MKYVPLYLTALFNSLLLATGNKFPALRARWHISTLWATIIIVTIIIVGLALIYVVVIVPIPTTTTYP